MKRPACTVETPRPLSVDPGAVREANLIPGTVFKEPVSVTVKPRRLVEMMVEGGNATVGRF